MPFSVPVDSCPQNSTAEAMLLISMKPCNVDFFCELISVPRLIFLQAAESSANKQDQRTEYIEANLT